VDEHLGLVVIWIGISQVSYKVNHGTAVKCKELLIDHDTKDVEVEMRKSKVILLGGPRLFKPADERDPTAKVRRPFYYTLGFPICTQSTPWAEGAAGFFLDEGGDGNRLFLVSARHIVLHDPTTNLMKVGSQPRCDPTILSDSSSKQPLAFIKG
jgi:hypothetical protein